MRKALYIARRLSLSAYGAKKSPAIRVAMVSTALGIAVMLLAISVVRGFRAEIRDRITGFDAHISLYPAVVYEEDSQTIAYTDELTDILSKQPYIRSASPMLTAPILLKTPGAFKGLYLRGVEQGYDFSFLRSSTVGGQVPQPADSLSIMISQMAADKLGLAPGDSVNLFMSDDLRARKVGVSGVYNTHFDSYDRYFAYGSAALVRALLDLPAGQYSSIEITTDNIDKLPENNARLISQLNAAIKQGRVHQSIKSVSALEKGAHYFAWLDLLDVNVWVILVLMSLVALFTLIAGMLVIILEKIRVIGVLRAIGASKGLIRRIFIVMALRISLVGMIWGTLIAMGVILMQKYTHIIPLDATTYYMDYVPVSVEPLQSGAVLVAFMLVAYLALILPSYFAGRMKPASTMRFEM